MNALKIGAGIAGIAAACLGTKAFAVPKIKISKMEKLSAEETPSGKFMEYMPDEDTIFGYVEDLCAMGARMPGTEAGTKAQVYVKEKLEEAGLEDVQIIPAETKHYSCSEYFLSVGGAEIPCCYINFTGYDGIGPFDTGNIETELVYVGKKKDANVDVKGKIVVADASFASTPIGLTNLIGMMYDPNNTYRLTEMKKNIYIGDSFIDSYFNYMKKGAAGYVGILVDYYDTPEYLSENYTYYGEMNMPGLWLNASAGAKVKKIIKEAERDGKAAIGKMHLKGSLDKVQAGAVAGFVKGKSEETVLVHSHYDSITVGASEDASGTAAVLALAGMYGRIPAEHLDKSIVFLLADSHFTDYDTHDAVVEKLLGGDGNNGGNIVANLCIEHICDEYVINEQGGISPTGNIESRIVFTTPAKELNRIVQEEFIRHRMDRTLFLPADFLGDDLCTDADMFYLQGVPVCSMVSAPIYLYSNDDTPDKIPEDQLWKTCACFSDILMRFLKTSREKLKY